MNMIAWLVVFVIVDTIILAVKSDSLALERHPAQVSVNSYLLLSCKTPSPVTSVTWLKTNHGSTSEEEVGDQILNNGICSSNSPTLPDGLDFFCNSTTVFSCVIKALSVSNSGQKWRCFAFIAGVKMYSNEIKITITDACETKYAALGANDEKMTFNYTWTTSTTRSITCSKNQTDIGSCHGTLLVKCGLESNTFDKVYHIASTTDLTSVTLTILYFNESTAGKYSCSKPGNVDVKTVCMEIDRAIRPVADDGFTPGAMIGLGIGAFLSGLLVMLLIHFVWYIKKKV